MRQEEEDGRKLRRWGCASSQSIARGLRDAEGTARKRTVVDTTRDRIRHSWTCRWKVLARHKISMRTSGNSSARIQALVKKARRHLVKGAPQSCGCIMVFFVFAGPAHHGSGIPCVTGPRTDFKTMMRAVLDSSVHFKTDTLKRRVSVWTPPSRHRSRIQVYRSWSRAISSDNIGTTGRRQITREVLDLLLAGKVVGTGEIVGEGRGGSVRVTGRQHEGSGQRFCGMSDQGTGRA